MQASNQPELWDRASLGRFSYRHVSDQLEQYTAALPFGLAEISNADESSISIDFCGKKLTTQFPPAQLSATQNEDGTFTLNQTSGSTSLNFGIHSFPVSSAADGDWSDGNTWDFGYKILQYPIVAFDVTETLLDGSEVIDPVLGVLKAYNKHENFGPNNGAVQLPSFKYRGNFYGHKIIDSVSLGFSATFAVNVVNVVSFTQGLATVDSITIKNELNYTGGTLTILKGITNGGTLEVSSSALSVQNSITNQAAGLIEVDHNASLASSINNSGMIQSLSSGALSAAVTNQGTIEAASAGNLAISGIVSNAGIIQATGASSFLSITGTVSNKGMVQAVSGGTLSIYSYPGTAAGVTGGTLTASSGGTVEISGSALISNATFGGDGTGSFIAFGGTLQNDTVAANQMLTVAQGSTSLVGSLSNAGTVNLSGGIYPGGFVVNGVTSLSGHGTVVVSGLGISGTGTLTNVDNTLYAGGFDASGNAVQGGYISVDLVNSASGIIEGIAYEGGSMINLSAAVTNQGTIEAASAGNLAISGIVSNSGIIQATGASSFLSITGTVSNKGMVQAVSGGTLRIYSYPGTAAGVTGGTLTASSGGTVEISGSALISNATFGGDGTGSFIAFGGTLQNDTVAANQMLTVAQGSTSLVGSLSNAGTVNLSGGIYPGGFVVNGVTSLSGHGTVVVSGLGISGTGTLTNVDNTLYAGGFDASGNAVQGGYISVDLVNSASGIIEGIAYEGGSMINLSAAVTNQGTIEAASAGNLAISGIVSNSGIIQATGASSFLSITGTVSNKGMVQAVSGGTLRIYSYPGTAAGVTGGTLTASSGGTVEISGSALISNATFGGDGTGSFIAFGGTLQNDTVAANQMLTVAQGSTSLVGSLSNAGTVNLSGGIYPGGFVVNGVTSLSGHGTVVVSGLGISGTGTLTNVDNTLYAGGFDASGNAVQGGYISVDLVNSASGIIEGIAYEGGSMINLSAAVTNQGTIEAASAGNLAISGIVSNAGIIQATGASSFLSITGTVSNKGMVQAVSGGTLRIYSYPGTAAGVTGGTLTASSGGTVEISGSALISNATFGGDGTGSFIAFGGTLQNDTVAANQMLTVAQGSTSLVGSLSNAGTIMLVGNSMDVDAQVTNAGTIEVTQRESLEFSASLTNNGLVLVSDSTDILDSSLFGTGYLSIDSGTVSLHGSVVASESMQFLSSGGEVDVYKPSADLGTFLGFGIGDVIDLERTHVSDLTYANNILDVYNGNVLEAQLSFAGSLTVNNFVFSPDNHGGTQIQFHG